MSGEIKIQPGKDEAAVVERVVPGKLVYVATIEGSQRWGFKLDQLIIRSSDGSCRPYRGEPLAKLGVVAGRKVIVWGITYRDVPPALVIDVDHGKEFLVTIGSSISTAVNATIGKILR
jgi:hypothetical protein